MNTWLTQNWLKLVAILMLLGALLSLPYVYYQYMEWVVVGAAIMTAYQAYKQKKTVVVWVFALIVVTFNPLAPIYLNGRIWQFVDVGTAAIFISSLFILRKN